ncbi:MAG: hypothetical protein AAF573_00185 [Bacteroidota bacterium]
MIVGYCVTWSLVFSENLFEYSNFFESKASFMYISPNVPFHRPADFSGKSVDLKLLQEDKWLMNTEVKYHLMEKNGLWHLTMIYIATDNPFKFICRKIDTYNSEKKAKTFASILQRGIRKDARGTLKTNQDAFNFCNN